jgi:NAD(P)-dependent dehydrogenase (short-subunit alcohol dehydrogenase family)
MSKRVLILGGYGGFGARLSRRLAGDGWEVLVAGRSLTKAAAFAGKLNGARALCADRNAPLDGVLAEFKPDLLVDAAGPFQGSGYQVAESCIAHGVHYLDLADARDFVCGIGRLDAAARRAGVVVVSGVSSVPALSGAVVRELSRDMEEIRSIEEALSASTRASVGASIVAALLSYVGKPVPMWDGHRWTAAIGWRMLRRERYAVAGTRPLHRLVALADIPDQAIFPGLFPGHPATRFSAGPEFSLQLLALWLLSWLVSWGWLSSLRPWAGWLAPLQRLTARLGSDRSAMAIEVKGIAGGVPLLRRWTVIAERGDGPEIPTLATQLLAGRIAAEQVEPGARHSAELLSLADFAAKFDELAIVHQVTEQRCDPLYQRVMGADFAKLSSPLLAMHAVLGQAFAKGEGTVRRGRSLLARVIGAVMRFPRAGHYPVEVAFIEKRGVERWTRTFGQHTFASELSQTGTLLTERFGPLRFHFALPISKGGLSMELRKWSAFGVRLPLFLAPRITASEHAEGDDFQFDVAVAVPLAGPVVHYSGRLRRTAQFPVYNPAHAG